MKKARDELELEARRKFLEQADGGNVAVASPRAFTSQLCAWQFSGRSFRGRLCGRSGIADQLV
jgi:hypothetical protein